MLLLSSRSAIVRDTFNIRSYALADRPNFSRAFFSNWLTSLLIVQCSRIRTGVIRVLQNRLTSYIWSFQECFSFSRFLTSSSVPQNGPGVSILIDTRAAANFNDSGTS
jgi:hypothetical protein